MKYSNYFKTFTTINFCAYRERLPRIWTKFGGNSSYKPPGASCTAPGPYILQGNGKMRERNLYNNSKTIALYSLRFPFWGLYSLYIAILPSTLGVRNRTLGHWAYSCFKNSLYIKNGLQSLLYSLYKLLQKHFFLRVTGAGWRLSRA